MSFGLVSELLLMDRLQPQQVRGRACGRAGLLGRPGVRHHIVSARCRCYLAEICELQEDDVVSQNAGKLEVGIVDGVLGVAPRHQLRCYLRRKLEPPERRRELGRWAACGGRGGPGPEGAKGFCRLRGPAGVLDGGEIGAQRGQVEGQPDPTHVRPGGVAASHMQWRLRNNFGDAGGPVAYVGSEQAKIVDCVFEVRVKVDATICVLEPLLQPRHATNTSRDRDNYAAELPHEFLQVFL